MKRLEQGGVGGVVAQEALAVLGGEALGGPAHPLLGLAAAGGGFGVAQAIEHPDVGQQHLAPVEVGGVVLGVQLEGTAGVR